MTNPPGQDRKGERGLGILRFRTVGLVAAVAVLALFFQSQRPTFLSPDNLLTIARAMSALAIIAFAQMFVIILGELDLSVGSVYLLASTTLAVLWLGAGPLDVQLPLVLAVVVALLVAVLAGATNAFFTTVVGIPSFIATLGMLSVAQGLALLISNAENFNPAYNEPPPPAGEVAAFTAIGGATLPFGVPIQGLWLVVFFGLFWVLRHRTLFGFRCLAIGGNPQAAQVTRLPVTTYKFVAFVLTAVMAAVAGILDFSYIGSVGPTAGVGLTFPVFAAVVIGGVSLTGGRGTVVGTLLGAVLLSVLNNGLALLGVGSFVQLIFVGVVTIGAVSLDRVSVEVSRRRTAAALVGEPA